MTSKQFLYGLAAAAVALFVYNMLAGRNSMAQGQVSTLNWFYPAP
jgi:hypothetical protein